MSEIQGYCENRAFQQRTIHGIEPSCFSDSVCPVRSRAGVFVGRCLAHRTIYVRVDHSGRGGIHSGSDGSANHFVFVDSIFLPQDGVSAGIPSLSTLKPPGAFDTPGGFLLTNFPVLLFGYGA